VPRTPGYADGATPPSYVTRAYRFDDSWKDDAVCRGHNKPGSPFQHAWTADPSNRYTIGEGDGAKTVTGQMLLDVGLTFCAMCPAQWDCAIWAINVGERTGTWGMLYDDLIWLREQKNPINIIESARGKGASVQVAVSTRRHRVRPVRVGT